MLLDRLKQKSWHEPLFEWCSKSQREATFLDSVPLRDQLEAEAVAAKAYEDVVDIQKTWQIKEHNLLRWILGLDELRAYAIDLMHWHRPVHSSLLLCWVLFLCFHDELRLLPLSIPLVFLQRRKKPANSPIMVEASRGGFDIYGKYQFYQRYERLKGHMGEMIQVRQRAASPLLTPATRGCTGGCKWGRISLRPLLPKHTLDSDVFPFQIPVKLN